MIRLRSLALVAASLLLLAPLSSCAASASLPEDPSVGVVEPGMAAPLDQAPFPGDAGADSGPQLAEVAPADAGAPDRSIVRSGDLALTVPDIRESTAQITELTRELTGSVESEYVSPDGATLAIRVPADRLDAAFARLSELGEVSSQTRSAVDVTTEHVDLTARVAALEASVDRLTELMAEASSTGDLIEAETALAQRQQELDGLTAQLNALEGQIAQATIWVTLTPEHVLPGGGPTTFWDGVLTGFQSLGAAAAGGLVVLGILAPWLLLGGVIAGAVIWLVRALRRRRRASATPRVPAQPAAPAGATPGADPAGTDLPGADPARADLSSADPAGTAPDAAAPSGPSALR